MDFHQDFLVDARKWLSHWGVTHVHAGTTLSPTRQARPVRNALSEIGDDDIGVAFFRVRARLPTAVRRMFSQSPRPRPMLDDTELCGLRLLQQDVEAGRTLRPRLSRGWQKGQEDGLLSDWNLHHFHLGVTVQSDGFVERTRHIAIAMVTPGRFLLVDVRPHGSGVPLAWPDLSLLETIDAHWPEELEPYHMNFVLKHAFEQSKDITQLRQHGIMNLITVNGHALLPPGGGVAADGASFRPVERYTTTCHAIRWLQDDWHCRYPEKYAELRYLPDGEFGIQDERGRLWQQVRDEMRGTRFEGHPGGEQVKDRLRQWGLWRHVNKFQVN